MLCSDAGLVGDGRGRCRTGAERVAGHLRCDFQGTAPCGATVSATVRSVAVIDECDPARRSITCGSQKRRLIFFIWHLSSKTKILSKTWTSRRPAVIQGCHLALCVVACTVAISGELILIRVRMSRVLQGDPHPRLPGALG